MAVNNTPVVWKRKKQVGVALSYTEAEYIALSECVKETKWIRMMLEEMNTMKNGPMIIWEDNTGMCYQMVHGRKKAKHVDIRFHFVKDEEKWYNKSTVLSHEENGR